MFFCLLRLVACSVFLFAPFGPSVFSWRVFGVNMTHLSLSCPSTRNWNTISFFKLSHLHFLCQSTMGIADMTHLSLSCPSTRNSNTISISSLVFLIFFAKDPSVFASNPLHCNNIGSFYIQLFQLRLWDSHRVWILLSHSVCSLFRIFCLFEYSSKPWHSFTISKYLLVHYFKYSTKPWCRLSVELCSKDTSRTLSPGALEKS